MIEALNSIELLCRLYLSQSSIHFHFAVCSNHAELRKSPIAEPNLFAKQNNLQYFQFGFRSCSHFTQAHGICHFLALHCFAVRAATSERGAINPTCQTDGVRSKVSTLFSFAAVLWVEYFLLPLQQMKPIQCEH